ncbi:MAG TPA: glutathione S-transferase family protein [Paracoccaceae bacterium]|nr:glutathione S-transferase family protein [Paracoccaceae bacterium]
MAKYRLHCFAQSGNAYKDALYLELAGCDWEAVKVDFFTGQHRTPEFAQINEMAQVPVFEHGDVVLSQSGLILDYLVEQEGRFGWSSPEERREVMRWLLWDNYSFTSTIAPLRFLAHFMPEEKRNPDVIGFLQGRMKAALKVLDKRLEGREFVATPGLSIADLSIVGYLYYGEELPFDLGEYPNVVALTERIAAMPGFKAPYELMPDGR